MKGLFYQKLAFNNIKKNSKTYIPYILTCICTIIMYYTVYSLSKNSGLKNVIGGSNLVVILTLGTYVVGFFSLIFLFYTNSFLIKRRKKEFGLFNILGMEKKHISKIVFFETIYVAAISFASGILGGILFEKLMYMFLLKILHFDVKIDFEISISAIISTIVLFSIIFILTLLNTMRQIHLANPIELLRGGNVGEKEPKAKWLVALLGAICLAIGYFIAVTTKSPIDAIYLFFVAVILVIIGTYCLFTTGSIVVLKLLRKNKKYYYQTKHFTSISGMIYRMKQNAVGLANICILSTAVLVTLSTTVSLYVGMEDVLRTRYFRNIVINSNSISDEGANELDNIIDEATSDIDKQNIIHYRYISFPTIQSESGFSSKDNINYSASNIAMISIITLEEYNRITDTENSLNDNQVFLYTLRGNVDGDNISIDNFDFEIKEKVSPFDVDTSLSAFLTNNYYMVVSDEAVLEKLFNSLTGQDEKDVFKTHGLCYYYGFDAPNTDSQTQIDITDNISKAIKEQSLAAVAECVEANRQEFYAIYGTLFFLGIFLGLLFIMATVLIIYYKQISEGYDDKNRFEIMQKVGMSHIEVKKSIRSQVLTVFFLPLITAVIHIAFAFGVISKLLNLLNLSNITLFVICTIITILVFAVFYAIVYALTARTYYKIVE